MELGVVFQEACSFRKNISYGMRPEFELWLITSYLFKVFDFFDTHHDRLDIICRIGVRIRDKIGSTSVMLMGT